MPRLWPWPWLLVLLRSYRTAVTCDVHPPSQPILSGFSGDWPAGLDPATNINGAADQSQMDAIFGELFELGPKGKIVPDLATAYKISNDGKSITITLRQGVTFTDGTPFNAAAVVWNLQRDLKSSCTCKPTWPVTSVTATGPQAVTINLSAPDGAFIDQIFDSIANWIASPTAVQKMGAKAFAAAAGDRRQAA